MAKKTVRRRKVPVSIPFVAELKHWLITRGPWWATSVVAHAVILSAVMLTIKVAAPNVT